MNPIHRFLVALSALFILSLPSSAESGGLPPMPQPATSFGAAIAGGAIYVYGGNTGKAHEFNKECVKGDFFRLKAPSGKEWEKLPGGQPLLSSSLVGYEGKVIRIGGMSALNEKGAKNDLRSTDEVMCFDPAKGQWEAMAKLPEPRSSHDSAVLGHTLYVGGGWKLAADSGDGKTQWHDTLLTLDLSAPEKGWQSQPQPFQRRALAVVAQGGRVWFIGGMDNHDELVRTVDWFDPATKQWGKGPDLPDGTMAGFGVAACVQGEKLYATPFSGEVLTLSADGKQWEKVTKLNPPRFFHRLLPLADGRLAAVGGSNSKGHVTEVELVSLDAKTSEAAPAESPAAAPKNASVKQPSESGGFAWPQWRGPHRDGISDETGWRKDWPAEGLPKLWSTNVGIGLSSPVVADGRVITQGNDGDGTDSVVAFDAATGNELWRFSLPCKSNSYGMEIVPNGPAATPTISGGHVFALTREGDVICLDVSNGKLVWQKFLKDIGGRRPVYGYTQSPLVADGRVFLDIGAKPGRVGSTAALDAATGEIKWKAGSGEAGYSSARMFERDGHQFVAMLKGEALDVFDPADGHVLWSYHITGRDYTNSLTPVFVGHRILVGNSSEPFARLLDWDLGAEPNVRVAWKNQQFTILFNNPILYRDCLFAFNEKRRGFTEFTCLDAQTGESHWVSDAVPLGTFILSDNHWIFLSREGEVALASASVTEVKTIARFKAFEGKCYATPALANGRLYVRDNAGHLNAYDLRAVSAH